MSKTFTRFTSLVLAFMLLLSVIPNTIFTKTFAAPADDAYAQAWPMVGAEYTAYTSRDAAQKAMNNVKNGQPAGLTGVAKTTSNENAVFVIGANNLSQKLEFATGNYYVVETKVPKGWTQDINIRVLQITPSSQGDVEGKDLLVSPEGARFFKASIKKDVTMLTDVYSRQEYMQKHPITGAKFVLFENKADAQAVIDKINVAANSTNYPKTISYSNAAKDVNGAEASFTIKADGTCTPEYRWFDSKKIYYAVEVERPIGYTFSNKIVTISGGGNTTKIAEFKENEATTYVSLDKSYVRNMWLLDENDKDYGLEITWAIYIDNNGQRGKQVAIGKTNTKTGKMEVKSTYPVTGDNAVQLPLGKYIMREEAIGLLTGQCYEPHDTALDLSHDGDINKLTKVNWKNNVYDPQFKVVVSKQVDADYEQFYNQTLKGTQFTVYYIPDSLADTSSLYTVILDADGKEKKVIDKNSKTFKSVIRTWVFEAQNNDTYGDILEVNGHNVMRIRNDIEIPGNYVGGDPLFIDQETKNPIMPIGTYIFEETKSTRGFSIMDPWHYVVENNSSSTQIWTDYKSYTLEDSIAVNRPQTIVLELEKTSNNSDKTNYYGSLAGAEFKVEFFDPMLGEWTKAIASHLPSNDDSADYIISTDINGKAETYPMKPGKYRITEVKAPEGHTLNVTATDADGNITFVNGTFEFTLEEYLNATMNNGQKVFTFKYDSKYTDALSNHTTYNLLNKIGYNEAGDKELLTGAKIQLWELDSSGNLLKQLPIDSQMEYTTTSKPIELYGLTAGKTYRFLEIAPPEGYLQPMGSDAYTDFTIADDDAAHNHYLENEKEPKIESYATTSYGTKEQLEGVEATIVDKFVISDLMPNHPYSLREIQLINVEDGSVAATAEDVTFTPNSSKAEVTATFNTSLLSGKYVVTAKLHRDDRQVITQVAVHDDMTDFNETILVPEVGTYAFDANKEEGSDYDNFILNEGSAVIKDRVDYRNLVAGEEYIAVTKLMDAETLEILKEGDVEVSKSTKFVPSAEEGSVYVEYELDASKYQGKTFVIFEYIYKVVNDENVLIGKHEDPSDDDQTVKIPELKTSAYEVVVGEDESYMFELTDVVNFNNLPINTDVVGTATAMDKETGKPFVDSEGNTYSASVEFNTGETGSGVYSVSFNIPYSEVEGKTIVMFEDAKIGDITIATHFDWNDDDQTVHFPKIATQAFFVNDEGEEAALTKNNLKDKTTVNVTDKVALTNLEVGEEYTVLATLLAVQNGETFTVAEAEEIKFTADAENMIVDANFGEIEISNFITDDTKFVVVESLYRNSIEEGRHYETTDEDQTIRVPSFNTNAEDKKDGDKYILNDGTQTIVDRFTYRDLMPGVEVIVDTYLVDLEGNKLLDAEGNPVSVQTSLIPEEKDGEIFIEIPVDGKYFEGQTLTVFEDVYENDVLIGVHHDLSQESQTVYVPEIKTVAAYTQNHEEEVFTLDFTDVVSYKGLPLGETFLGKASIMDIETKEVLKDGDKEYSKEYEFTTDSTDGTFKVTIPVPADLVKGKTFVMFEELFRVTKNENGEEVKRTPVAQHLDWEDKDQTVDIPEIGTKAELAEQYVNKDNEVTIKDTIKYKNLVPGKTYTFEGKLIDKETNEPIVNEEGDVVIATTQITPEKAEGETEVLFTLNLDNVVGRSLVVFERAYEGETTDNMIATHEDITDKDQTVDMPMELIVTIKKVSAKDTSLPLKGAEITIVDDKDKTIKDKNGKDCVGITDEKGEVKFSVFYKDADKIFAKETKAPQGYHINTNKFQIKPNKDAKYQADIEVKILDMAIVIPPVNTGDNNNMVLWIVLGIVALVVGFISYRKVTRK